MDEARDGGKLWRIRSGIDHGAKMSKVSVHEIVVFILMAVATSSIAYAQKIPAHAEGLEETLVSVQLDANRKQSGVYSIKSGTKDHAILAVLLPGYPSVVRPVVSDGVMVGSRLTGNFLIRARRHLADSDIALLTVDCHSDSGDYCSSGYQASKERQRDVQMLIDSVKQQNPSLTKVWMIGTSMGTISSSFMPLHQPNAYAGAIHTASITEPYARNSYSELADFDYRKSGIPQFFVHHRDDPCRLTTHEGAERIAKKFNFPLLTVYGGSGFQGNPCEAQTQHGFKGVERQTMLAIAKIMKSGRADSLELR